VLHEAAVPRVAPIAAAVTLALIAGCGGDDAAAIDASVPVADGGVDAGGDLAWEPDLGARFEPDGDAIRFRVASERATRVELALFAEPLGATEVLRLPLEREAPDGAVWAARVTVVELVAAGIDPATVFYGYRVWGPNWPYDPAWSPGSSAGFVADVDEAGNRMNPNKLLIDPYAREISHDPTNSLQLDRDPYRTGDTWPAVDSGPVAPKSIVLPPAPPGAVDLAGRPARPFKDEVIYEVHLRGLTRADAGAGACAGTYAGAATRAAYLAGLGVTAIELLPVQETWNDGNDVDPGSASGDNYWGYSTLAYLAPDRRYACDRTPGGPTREFRDMVRAFHAHGIKVYVDVVYNHTAEGGGGSLYSLRGLDNAGYYQLSASGKGFTDHTGIGANVAANKPLAAGLIVYSLRYWAWGLGVDGFRFDLAPVLGNVCGPGCFDFEKDGVLARIAEALPVRPASGGPGVDLVAEPWAIGPGTYQIGNFPVGWAEWNGQFRDLIRADQNRLGVTAVTPGWLADRLSGSPSLFRDDGRKPWSSVNFVVSHDGFTLRDQYACNGKNNAQPWPYGPSDGGSDDNLSWDQNGEPARQRQAARTGLALTVLAAGVPMIVGGDELLRTQRCNNNPYNLDSPGTWHDWSRLVEEARFVAFTRRLLAFRAAHPALRPADWRGGDEVRWLRADGGDAAGAYMDDAGQHYLGWRIAGAGVVEGEPALAIFVAYNGGTTAVEARLPARRADARWYRVADTGAWMEPQDNFHAEGSEYQMQGDRYMLAGRSLALFVERAP
jgi:glycogen operon protein